MTSAAKPSPIPDSYRRVTPTLTVAGAVKALEFYGAVFGATERMRFPGPGGSIAHAEIHIGDPFGHGWTVASHIEDVTPDELMRRMADLFGSARS